LGRKADGPFDLVIFDLDGVLVDSEPISSRVAAAALTEAGIEISAAAVCERFLGVSTAAMLRAIEAEHGRRLPESFQEKLRAQGQRGWQPHRRWRPKRDRQCARVHRSAAKSGGRLIPGACGDRSSDR
jgi:phosphoglycolate phosphatase-like HAD superfamily hydrolase